MYDQRNSFCVCVFIVLIKIVFKIYYCEQLLSSSPIMDHIQTQISFESKTARYIRCACVYSIEHIALPNLKKKIKRKEKDEPIGLFGLAESLFPMGHGSKSLIRFTVATIHVSGKTIPQMYNTNNKNVFFFTLLHLSYS